MRSENESAKQSHQFKALVYKNLMIQARQPCTNVCQIITPIICLIFTLLIRNVCISKIPNDNDSIFKEFPLVPQKFNNYTLEDMVPWLVNRDCSQWYSFQTKNQSDKSFVGINDGRGTRNGILGKMPQTYKGSCAYNFSKEAKGRYEYYVPPMFRENNQSVDKYILDTILFYNQLPYDEVKFTKTSDKIPDGSITFSKANKDYLQADLKINDQRVLEYHRSDGVTKIQYYIEKLEDYKSYYLIGEGFLSLQHALTSAYIEEAVNKKVDAGMLYMPFLPTPSVFVDILVSTITTILFPLSLSLLLPVFLYLVVLEKEQRLIQMMRMNGMKMRNYWFVNFVFNFSIGAITNLVFCVFGFVVMDLPFFNNTGKFVLVFVLTGWILVQIGMATFFQVFLKSSRAANIIGYLISIWTTLIGATLSIAIFQYPRPMPIGYLLYPTFSFNRIFYLMFQACSNDSCFKQLSDLSDESVTCLKIMYSSFFILQFLGMYLHEVIPQEFGTRQPLDFPIRALMAKIRGNNRNQNADPVYDSSESSLQQNDDEAKRQRQRISDIVDFADYALVISNLKKVYSNGKQAVKGLDLIVKDREVFGLLGPNGAGKTTLISMITGVFSPTQGNCYVGGYSILNQIQMVHLCIGVCPQFDLLWPQLTVEEHFYFYARLRGTPSSKLKETVEDTLQDVNLTQFRNFKSTQLSGGMKRRLSVGISMVGDPRIVFLDEPTTGLDPQNRRNLWEVLNKCKQKRALFLTTHLMEQADALCNRIGIITEGTLRTIGIAQRLKRIYGKGYHLSVNVDIERATLNQGGSQNIGNSSIMQEEDIKESVLSEEILTGNKYIPNLNETMIKEQNAKKVSRLKAAVKKIFPQAELEREINGYFKYNIGDIVISEAMRSLASSDLAELQGNWSLSNSNLEDVFLEVVNRFETIEQEAQPISLHTIQESEE